MILFWKSWEKILTKLRICSRFVRGFFPGDFCIMNHVLWEWSTNPVLDVDENLTVRCLTLSQVIMKCTSGNGDFIMKCIWAEVLGIYVNNKVFRTPKLGVGLTRWHRTRNGITPILMKYLTRWIDLIVGFIFISCLSERRSKSD